MSEILGNDADRAKEITNEQKFTSFFNLTSLALDDYKISDAEVQALQERFGQDNEQLQKWFTNERQQAFFESTDKREELVAEYNNFLETKKIETEAKKNSQNSFKFTVGAPHYAQFSPVIAQEGSQEKDLPESDEEDEDIEETSNSETQENDEVETSPQETAIAATAPAKTQEETPKDKYISEKPAEIKTGEKSGSFVVSTQDSVLNVRNEKGEKISTLQKGQDVKTTGKFVELSGEKFVEVSNNQFVSTQFLKEKPQNQVAQTENKDQKPSEEKPKEETPATKSPTNESSGETQVATTNNFSQETLNTLKNGGETFTVKRGEISFEVSKKDLKEKVDGKMQYKSDTQIQNVLASRYNTEKGTQELAELTRKLKNYSVDASVISSEKDFVEKFRGQKVTLDNVRVSKNEKDETLATFDLDTKWGNKYKNISLNNINNVENDIQSKIQTAIASHLQTNGTSERMVGVNTLPNNDSKV